MDFKQGETVYLKEGQKLSLRRLGVNFLKDREKVTIVKVVGLNQVLVETRAGDSRVVNMNNLEKING